MRPLVTLLSAFAVLLIPACGSDSSDPPPPAPSRAVAFVADGFTLALWHFDEMSGTSSADASGNGNNMALNALPSAPAWTAAGRFNGCLDYEAVGSQWAASPLTALFPTNQATVEFWYLTTLKAGTITNGDNISLAVGWTASQLQFSIGDGSTAYALTVTSAAVNNLVADGSWHYIAAVWDGLRQRIYVDAVEVAVSSPLAVMVANPSGWYVGGNGGPYITGRVDEMRFSETARTPTEISAHFAGPP